MDYLQKRALQWHILDERYKDLKKHARYNKDSIKLVQSKKADILIELDSFGEKNNLLKFTSKQRLNQEVKRSYAIYANGSDVLKDYP